MFPGVEHPDSDHTLGPGIETFKQWLIVDSQLSPEPDHVFFDLLVHVKVFPLQRVQSSWKSDSVVIRPLVLWLDDMMSTGSVAS